MRRSWACDCALYTIIIIGAIITATVIVVITAAAKTAIPRAGLYHSGAALQRCHCERRHFIPLQCYTGIMQVFELAWFHLFINGYYDITRSVLNNERFALLSFHYQLACGNSCNRTLDMRYKKASRSDPITEAFFASANDETNDFLRAVNFSLLWTSDDVILTAIWCHYFMPFCLICFFHYFPSSETLPSAWSRKHYS